MKGDIVNQAYAGRAKQYIWSQVSQVLPRGITPTDIDAMIEIGGCFLFFEGKTAGSVMPQGQRLAYKRLLKLGGLYCVLLIGEHPTLDVVEVGADLSKLRLVWWNNGWQTRDLASFGLVEVLDAFARDADRGSTLAPWSWLVPVPLPEPVPV